ncbi:MAG: hypothetical protein KF773_04780 [Deltaproteobacteria bacterium]|nr:hypothetical protein [Deltaproteobacteria bacterium]
MLKVAHAATVATLMEATKDPIDAMRLAADLFAMSAYRAERAVALEAGMESPRAPRPISKYLRAFIVGLKARLNAIGGMLDADELDRLTVIAPALAERLEHNDLALIEEVYKVVVGMHPAEAAEWIREHLDAIESRFAL